MSLLLLMLPLMLVFGLILLGLLLWAVRNGQFEDLEGEKHRILFDEPGYAEATLQAAKPRG
ncbi:Cytochrome oxidase maturation protein cbb3-type [compost metagenome]